MGIRARLLALSVCVTVPLILFALAEVQGVWRESRRQLDASLEQQAKLSGVILERWLEAQRLTLRRTAMEYTLAEPPRPPAFLPFIKAIRPRWIDVRILDAEGRTVAVEPSDAPPFADAMRDELLAEMRRRNRWAVVTSWERGANSPLIVLGEPIEGNRGTVVARIDGAAIRDIFHDIESSADTIFTIYDARHRIFYRNRDADEATGTDMNGSPLFGNLAEGGTAIVETESPIDGVRRIYGLARGATSECLVTVSVPSATLYEPAERQRLRFAVLSLVVLLCAVAAALIIADGFLHPFRHLARAARKFGAGDSFVRAPVTGSGETKIIIAAFNDMADQLTEREARLTELDRLKSEFVGSVSHELRTPLTTIKALTHVLLRGAATEGERQEYLETIAKECDRQIDLVVNLLDLSRIEAGGFHLTRAPVEVAEVIAACIKSARHLAATRGQELRAEVPEDLPPVAADRKALRRALYSLVENAIKYTPDEGMITLAAEQTSADELAIHVIDMGRGISSEDLPHIFEKFYRGNVTPETNIDGDDATRNDETDDELFAYAETSGVGLGLYLTGSIVEHLGGRITVQSEVGRGSRFTIHLPVWKDDGETPDAG